MDTVQFTTLSNLTIAFSLIFTASYLLSQLSLFRRWLAGEASRADVWAVTLLLGLLSVINGEISLPYGVFLSSMRHIGPIIGGLYGGPYVGLGAGIVETLGDRLFFPHEAAEGILLTSTAGFLAGLLARFFKRPIRTRTGSLVVIVTLALHLFAVNLTAGWSHIATEYPYYLLNLLGILVIVKVFNNERNEQDHKRILEHLAVTDGLTKLYNHRYFHTHIERELEQAKQDGSQLALIMLDIDLFKQFNDTFGHPLGDQLLAAIGEELRGVVRSTDLVARYGGDEFAVILPHTEYAEAQVVAERAHKAVTHLSSGNHPGLPKFPIDVSIGLAAYPSSASDKDELIKKADEALYAAKHSANKIEVYYSVFDDLKAQLDQSEMSLINTIKTLLTVINAKDRYTYGHSERVVGYAVMIGRQLGLSPEEQKVVRVGAFLHDIGKIEIGREILNKETPMTPAEVQIIKQHPIWGAEIIQPVRSLKQVIPAVLHHHERYDGKGYPNGLKGEDIPFMARILSVADSFDAMTRDRPYQKAKSMDQATEELARCSGTQFDPWVVDAFNKALSEQRGGGRSILAG